MINIRYLNYVLMEFNNLERETSPGMKSNAIIGEIVEHFGKACSLPGSFQGSLAALIIYKDDYIRSQI